MITPSKTHMFPEILEKTVAEADKIRLDKIKESK
jgi:hypothetical protein